MTLLKVTSGSDVRVRLDLSSGGVPVNLTGRTVAVFDLAAQLVGRVSVAVLDPAGGAVQVSVEGTEPLPVGSYGFRVQVTGAGDSLGLPAFVLRVV